MEVSMAMVMVNLRKNGGNFNRISKNKLSKTPENFQGFFYLIDLVTTKNLLKHFIWSSILRGL